MEEHSTSIPKLVKEDECLHQTDSRPDIPQVRGQGSAWRLLAVDETLEGILDNTTSLITLKDTQGRYLLVNRQFEILFHVSQSELSGKTDYDIFPKETADLLRSNDRVILEAGIPLEKEEVVPHDNVRHTYISIKFPLFDADGLPSAVCTISTDITERKAAEEALLEAREELEMRIKERTSELVQLNLVLTDEIAERKRAETALREAEAKYRSIFENAVDGIYQSTPCGRFIAANPGLARMLGFDSPQELISLCTDVRSQHYVEPERRDVYCRKLEEQGVLQGFEYQAYRKDGSRIWVSETARAVRDPEGRTVYYEGTIKDITERRLAEEALRRANEKLEAWVQELQKRTREMTLLSEMGELLQACRTMNEAFAAVAQTARQLFASESGALCVVNTSQNVLETVALWGNTLPSERVFKPEECWGLRRGRVHLVEDTASGLLCRHLATPPPPAYLCVPMMAQGEALGIIHLTQPEHGRQSEARQRLVVTVAEHVSLALSNLKLHETLRSQSIRDPLTGLFNRRFMEESLTRELLRASRNQRPLGVIMLDLDHFKHFNDTFGHDAGDALLREVGSMLQAHIRGEDIACRYGGEEFTLILPEGSLETTRERAELLREAIKQLAVRHRNQTLGRVTVSLGIATFPDHGPTGESVLRAADSALYRAKEEGRDRVAIAR